MGREDRDNKLRDGLYVVDDRKTVVEHHDDGSVSFYREYSGTWDEHRTGGEEDAEPTEA